MAKRALWLGLTSALLLALVSGCAAARTEDSNSSGGFTGAAPPAAESVSPQEPGAESPAAQGEWEAADGERMIIYTGELALVVTDTEGAQDAAVAIAEGSGGYVASANSYAYEGGLRRITLSLRVPAASFNAAMAALRDLALEVTQDSIGSQDVTQEYVDLTSRLTALEAKAERLEELMEEAEDTEAVLAIYQELSETQIRIEETKGRMQYLERNAAMATINVYLTPDALSQPVEIAGWRPVGTMKRAVESLIATFQFLFDAAIWLGLLVLPVVGFISLVIYIFVRVVIWVARRLKRKDVD